MKTLLYITALIAATAAQSYGWIHPFPDYKKQFDDADLVAVVNVLDITTTGSTKRLYERWSSRLEFRECEVTMQIVTAFKGDATNSVKCRLYRFPTKKERDADFGEKEAAREYMAATPWESTFFVPKVHRNYLVYLKRSASGYYQTVTKSTVHNILELKVCFVSDPDEEAEQTD